VDIPSFSYQFSFEQSRDWSRVYAPGSELRAYAEHCIDKYGLRRRMRFATTVTAAEFDADNDVWRVSFGSGETLTARFVLNASGVMTRPKLPDIDGLDDFAGPAWHTARWDHSVDLTGKRVAIIGTGASAVQVVPEIAPKVKQLAVFQRTPIWCFPKLDARITGAAKLAMRLPGGRTVQRLLSQAFVEFTFPLAANYFTVNPFARNMAEAGRAYLRSQVHDPVLREKLTPRYAVGCKRPGFHNTYLSTFNRDNVELITDSIARVTENGVTTVDGRSHDVDVLIVATGFTLMDADAGTFAVTGPGGRSLARFWEENRLQAYEGVSVPGFPNMFSVFGPYGYVGSSYFALIETQVHHIVRCLAQARRSGSTRVEVSDGANDRYFAEMMRKRNRQIFWQPSCQNANSYYFDRNGDVPLRPTTTVEAYWRSRRFPLKDYEFTGATAARG
jgi:cyclohexanone monooxygenase